MHSNVQNSRVAELDPTVNDLGPLAWVLDELRKSLDGATKALKRFVKEAEAARGSDLAALDSSQLRIARQQLHQAVGALEMVGLPGPALVLRAMESAAQKFVQQPEHCNPEAAAKIERASFALTEYLEGVLSDRPVSAVSLFPQYREVQELVRADRVHPADLWPLAWRWLEPELAVAAPPRNYDSAARAVLDQAMLQLMKGKAARPAQDLRDLSLGFSASQTERQPRIFWKIAAAYFEALAHGLLESDLYVRRATSRVLLQYASLAKGDSTISERLAQDLLFFCAQATSSPASATPVLSAVRSVHGLTRFTPVNYELIQFGRFDPALLAQARKRITSAKETWSLLAAGDVNKFKSVADQFSLVTDSLVKLYSSSEPLAQALTRSIETTIRSAQAPKIELAMEVATSLLYLEAAFDDLDPNDPQLSARTVNLADRLERVRSGGEPQPLETWMEELYRRVSDKQTMGSVVGELRISLGELEKALDVFFRDPADKTALQGVPSQLSQMRGVLSVLGLDQASQAVLRMRESVEQMLVTEVDELRAGATGTFDHLGNNVGALSFLIDMLNYQPALAKKLFIYDEEKGELRPLMGRTQNTASAVSAEAGQGDLLSREVIAVVHDAAVANPDQHITERLTALANQAALAEQTALAQTAREASEAFSANNADAASMALSALTSTLSNAQNSPPSAVEPVDFEEDDLRDIFLEEAREVLGGGREAIEALAVNPGDLSQLTVLRRAFHTLKGSSRMVGLNEFGAAAWSFEQMLNGWMADQKNATEGFRALCRESLAGFENWIADIAANRDAGWLASAFCDSAEFMRSEGKYRALVLPVRVAEPGATAHETLEDFFELPDLELESVTPETSEVIVSSESAFDLDLDIDFGNALSDALPMAAPDYPLVSSDLHIEAIDLASLMALSGDIPVPPVVTIARPAEPTENADAGLAFAEGLAWSASDFDKHFTTHAEVPDLEMPSAVDLTSAESESESVAVAVVDIDELPGTHTIDTPDGSAFDEATVTAVTLENQEDEQIKVIGGLRIGIPLYNVYLNEADEWSRRLVTEVAEWSIELHQPISDSTVALAHSLAGSSATVGFHALSEIARALEQALQQSQTHHSNGALKYGRLFVDAAEDIRRLLHQFAAGFLKEPDADLLDDLKQLEFPDSILPPENEIAEPDFSPGHVQASDMEAKPVLVLEPGNLRQIVELPEPLSMADPEPVIAVPQPLRVTPAAPVTFAESSSAAERFTAEDDDEIDSVDAIDADLFPIFEEEAAELMPQLGGALRQWSARPENNSARNEVLRALHTLKGSARLAGAMRLGEMAHRIESEIDQVGTDAAATQEFEPLLTRFDAMQINFDGLRLAGAMASAAPAARSLVAGATGKFEVEVPVDDHLPENVVETITVSIGDARKVAIPAPQGMAMKPLRQAAAASVRVRSQLLDRMVNQAGEVMITRSRLEAELGQLRGSLNDMTGNLNRLRQQLRDIELQAETQMQSRLAQAKEAQAGFDPLEFDRFTRVQELTRMMAESVNDVATVQRTLQRTVEATEDDLIAQARQTRELQRDLLRTRMMEFEGISDRLYRVVRQTSKDAGKQVRLDLLGGTIELDRSMLDRLTPAFEHLLRNCVAHGIEAPEDRIKAGKEPVGLITVHLRHEGNDVSVDFSDDGAGLDLRRIREKALGLGLVTNDQTLDDQQASDLIFMPGFSTAAQVTEYAGRGIGMDVVRSEVNSLGGRIETSSVAGKGTHFKLVLPLTTAVTQVVMIRSGSLSVGVPANVVETVRRATAKELQQAYNTGFFDLAGESVPFFWSGALLQASRQSHEAQGRTTPVVVFRSAAQRIALHVDEVLGNQEVVVKHLGPQLSRLPGLAGMSVLASGAVVLIYNPVALASIHGKQARAWSIDRAESHALERSSGDGAMASAPMLEVPQLPLILVVDDSITVRRVTQRLLQREGYRVSLAADGLQALERLQDEVPAVVLSDIEMPRMDGFDLARNIRADSRLKGLPIIMITSRIAEKHREHAMELGVDHYLGKPYSEEELMRLVRNYCAAEVAVPA